MTVELGVGLTYHTGHTGHSGPPGLPDTLASNLDLIGVLEIEPERVSTPRVDSPGALRIDGEALELIRRIPCVKIVRGSGFSVGGSRLADPSSLAVLRGIGSALDAAWVSEPLAFRRAQAEGRDFDCGLPLPPRQTIGGARLAAHSVRSAANVLRMPFAVETGVNTLEPRHDEIPDGEFVSEVSEDAGSGIILDLDRVWNNARNGRQGVEAFVDRIPRDRVWGLRLSSGFERNGCRIDARSGVISEEILGIALSIVRRLPSLAAILFDIAPAYVPRLGASGLREQLKALELLWEERGRSASADTGGGAKGSSWKRDRSFSPREWEDALAGLVVGRTVEGPLAVELGRDPGLTVLQQILSEHRTSMVTTALTLTARLVTAAEGPAFYRSLLEGYWKKETPQSFASMEALGFAEHLSGLSLEIPYLTEVLDYEKALVRSILDGEHRVVSFQHDPRVVLRALAKGRLPGSPSTGRFDVEVAAPSSGPRLGAA